MIDVKTNDLGFDIIEKNKTKQNKTKKTKPATANIQVMAVTK